MWQNSRTQTVTKLKKQIVTKLERSNCNQTQKLKSCKLKKKINCDNSKTQIVIVMNMTVVTELVIMTSFSKNTLTPWQLTNSQGSFSQHLRCLVKNSPLLQPSTWGPRNLRFHDKNNPRRFMEWNIYNIYLFIYFFF